MQPKHQRLPSYDDDSLELADVKKYSAQRKKLRIDVPEETIEPITTQ